MNWLLSFVVGLATAAWAGFGVAWLATRWVKWHRISSFDGGAGYYVVFLTFLGLVVGGVLGLVMARVVAARPDPGFLKALVWSFGTVGGLLVILGGIIRMTADLPPTLDGRRLQLQVEIRTPVGLPLPTESERSCPYVTIEVARGESPSAGLLRFDEAQEVDNRWIVPATVPLGTSQKTKFLRARLSEENDVVVLLPFGSELPPLDMWSDWLDAGWPAGQSEPPLAERFSMRYRVELVPDHRLAPAQAEQEAQVARESEARAFAALTPTDPVAAWLPYTAYDVRLKWKATALNTLSAHPRLLDELRPIVFGSDLDAATGALRLFLELPRPTAEWNAFFSDVARDIIDRLRTAVAASVEADPSYEAAADASARFSAWRAVVSRLRTEAAGDFVPELAEMLELARQRPDSIALRQDVVRVASYYLKEWAGVAPLATDPLPR